MTESKTFQTRVNEWIVKTFGKDAVLDVFTRNNRFLEEAVELYQSAGGTVEDAHKLVDYVFGRPVGELPQEFGGVMLTLFSLGETVGEDVMHCAEEELERANLNFEAIRAKNAAKPFNSPLPGEYPPVVRKESCGNCSSASLRNKDKKGRVSDVHYNCALGRISEGNHVRHRDDWCSNWKAAKC